MKGIIDMCEKCSNQNCSCNSQDKEQSTTSYNSDKYIKNILLDNKYLVIEFTDGTFIPARLLDDIFKNEEWSGRCQFCKSEPSEDNQFATLDSQHYICQNCVKQMMQLLLNNGARIQLNYQAKSAL